LWKADCHQVPLCVESDDSKKKEADIQEDRADSLFIKSPASAKAEKRKVSIRRRPTQLKHYTDAQNAVSLLRDV